MKRINVGCGASPTPGWTNYDNSWSVRLASKPVTVFLLGMFGLLYDHQKKFIAVAKQSGIRWADVSNRIPEPDSSIDVLYSSHMLEHLNKSRALQFLREARRVLTSGGVIRLALPNIRFHVENYLKHNDADQFIHATRLSRESDESLKSLWGRFKNTLIGDRHHQWMYDGDSLCRLLSSVGFQNPQVMEPGKTIIPEPGDLNLRERVPESVFVEAVNPLH